MTSHRAKSAAPGAHLLASALTALLLCPAHGAADPEPRASWTQWGGPNRDFIAPADELATTWAPGEPEVLWRRDLGDGYSAVLFEVGRLYTMALVGEQEVVVCLDAASGQTLWETPYQHEPYTGLRGYGIGPRSTPLLVGDSLFAVGATGSLVALEKTDGRLLWQQDLWGPDFQGSRLGHGYASSPMAWKDTVVVPVGGEAGLVAFTQSTGEVRWRSTPFDNSYSSPRILDVGGERELVVFMAESLVGLDPDTGTVSWSVPHRNQWQHNIAMPLIADGVLFLSSPQAGARGVRLSRVAGAVRTEEVWIDRKVQLYHGSPVRLGDWVYGSSGVTATAFLVAVNIRTGEVGWRQRGFAKANLVGAGERLVILDENGRLAVATATPEGLDVHVETQLLDRAAWTAPTIVGTTLFVRDRGQILAADLG